MYISRILTIGMAFSALLAGCAAPVSSNIQPTAASVAKYGDMTDINVVAALEKNVNEARAADMPFLAPNYFKEATKVLSDCKNQLGNQPKDVLAKNAARGDAILEKGRAVMAIVKYRFTQELEIRARLDALGAAKLLAAEYKETMAAFSSLIEKVEREQPGNIDRDKEALLKSLEALEVKAVQESALHEAEAINAESRKKGAERQAAATFAEAQRVLQDAKKQIAAAPRDEKLVQSLGVKALFAARHASQVNERVARLSEQLNVSSGGMALGVGAGTGSAQAGVQLGGQSGAAERVTLEKIVLQEEDRLLAIATALGMQDMRDQPLDKQVEELKRAASQAKGTAGQEHESRLKAANDAAQQANAQLAAKDRQLKEQAAQLAEKDAQISALNARLDGATKPAAKPRTVKPKAVQPKTK